MAENFGRLYNKIISLAFFNIVIAISIRYNILYINILIFETSYIKFNMFNLIYYLSNT